MASYDMLEDEQNGHVDEEVEEEADGQYEVERIVGKMIKGKNKAVFYQVKWKNYGPDNNTWEPVKNLSGSKDMILEFEEEEKIRKNAASTSSSAKHAAAGSRSGTRYGDEDSIQSGSRSSDRKSSSGGAQSRAPVRVSTGKRADASVSDKGDDDQEKPHPAKRSRGAEVPLSRSGGRGARGAPKESEHAAEDDEFESAKGDEDASDNTEAVKPTGRVIAGRTAARSALGSTVREKPQQSGKKPSTLPDEIFPQENDRSTGNGFGRQANGKASGSGGAKPVVNGGGNNNNGNGLKQARAEIQKFAKAPVYANLTEAKSGKVDLKNLTVRGMFMSSEEEHFALLTGQRSDGKESVEFYVGARSLAASSDDLARQMVQALAQSIQVVMPSR